MRAPARMSAAGLVSSLLFTAASASAQTPPGMPLPTRTAGGGYALEAAHVHRHATAVAVALRLPVGSANDPEGRDGAAWLLARVLEDQASRALDPADAAFTATVDRATTVFTLIAVPGAWERAWERVDSVLFEAALDPDLVVVHRGELLADLAFEAGSPVAESEREAAVILADPGSPFTRPPRGTTASVAGLGPAVLESYRSAFHRRRSAVRAVVGPVGSDTLVPPRAREPLSDTAAPDPEPAWSTGDRRVEVRDVTSTWMSVAYPASPAVPRTHLELVSFLLEEELDPTPPDPDRYAVSVRIEQAPAGPVLLVEATVFPEAADRWERRILGTIERMASEPVGEDFFRWRRRRFRTHRLLRESAPEAEATRMSADLLRDGAVRDLGLEIWALDAGTLQKAARALGEPRIFRFGPDLRLDAQQGSRGGLTEVPGRPPTEAPGAERVRKRPTPP